MREPVLLAFDIGNTETTIGLFDGATLQRRWRLTTHAQRTPDELQVTLSQLVYSAATSPVKPETFREGHSLPNTPIDAAVICSVVPSVTQTFADACTLAFQTTPIVITPLSPLPITLQVDQPTLVGADRIVNTLAANQLHHRDAIVVDLGTATTYDCITAEGTFLGGIIQPGVLTASDTLTRRTSLLPTIALTRPERVIGTNTADCIKSGVVFGTADSVDGLIRRIKQEWPTNATPYVVATGGLAATFRPLCQEFDEVDPTLTLKGLQIAYSIISG